MTNNSSTRWQPIIALGLPALTMLFGLQTMRVLLPLIVYHYGVQPGVSTIGMGLYALGVFLAAFLAAAARRLLRPRFALLLTAGGVALLRLAEQFSPLARLDLFLATAGTVLFLFFLPVYLGHVRGQRERGAADYALGLLLGLALDTALHGLAGTLDLSWQPGLLTGIIVLVLALVQLALLARCARREPTPAVSDVGFLTGLPFLALGPLLFLQALIFQNVAQLTTLTGWPLPLALGAIVLGNALGLAAATLLVTRPEWNRWPLALLLGLGLLVALALGALDGWVAALGLIVGQVSSAGLLTLVLLQQGARADRPGLWRTTIAHGLGMFLFAVPVFIYYASYDLGLPLDNALLFYAAAATASVCALGATVRSRAEGPIQSPGRLAIGIALALLLLPLASFVAWRAPQPVIGTGYPARIMSYNLHQGFDTDGRLGMEALAQTIEREQPDVVALQEVSRGWYINGSLDTLTWLSRRLDMPYIFGPATDSVWGNAILSRYPIADYGDGKLPRNGSPMERGYLWACVDVGNGQELLVIVTHLHHVETDHDIHVHQVSTVLDFWAERPSAVILGDMNSLPQSPEMGLFRDAGLLDAFAELETGKGYTWPSYDPYERIDYIWYTPDFRADDFAITTGTASDHLGVAVTLAQ
ncbi:MAG: hypothetical protein DRJ03_13055 [Chloroflexi bacterium]|nr:MAG: hypothetical protein DRJ03_13055 [Chloroflexota bacterium]